MKSIFTIALVLGSVASTAQTLPGFKPLRYDEDYSMLAGDSVKDAYRRMKFIPLSKDRSVFLSTGGEARVQYFYAHNEGWGEEPKDGDGYLLTRWLYHADLHAGRHFRSFVQLQSSLANSRIAPNPIDDNPLDLHQAFVDIKPSPGFILRTGRQELLYGSQRLIAVRDGPNNRHSFDAVRGIFNRKRYRVDVLFGHYVAAKKGLFDDGFNSQVKLWGTYLVRNNLPLVKNADIYYLGLYKANAVFDDGAGRELRHSAGARIWSMKNNWRYDIEGLYQFGSLAAKSIRAWTLSVNTSYLFSDLKFKPELGFKTELISGDSRSDDDRIQTFNPLFPRGAYFGLAALIGPSNLVDIHPSLSLNLTPKLNFDIDYDVFWRYSRRDGVYGVNAALIYPAQDIFEKHIGRQLAATMVFRPNDFLYFRTEFTWFDTGDFLKKAGTGKDILFTGVTAQVKF